MIFQRINRSDAEQVFIVVQNVAGATISAGGVVVFDSGASVDGVRVTKPATATLSLLAGVAPKAIADSAYGIVQAYGYCQSAYVSNGTAGGTDIAAGDILIPVNAQTYLARSAASDGKTGFLCALEAFATATTPAAATKKVFIRAL